MFNLFLKTKMKLLGLFFILLLLIGSFISSIIFGRTPITIDHAIEAFLNYDSNSIEHMIIYTERLPRAVIATVVGASLAVAGALMQALTRNPLASPSIFGINAGAVFFIVLAVVFFSISSLIHLMWYAFFGAAISAIIVYFLGSIGRDGLTPIKIVLAGTAITALFVSFTQAILVLNETGLQDVLFWLAGSVSGRTLEMLIPILPFILVAGVISMFMGRAVNLLTTGDDIAKGMGQNIVLVKCVMGIIIVLLAGGSVAVVGAVGFIGLVVPHIARAFVGNDYRWVIPYSAVLGAVLLLSADVVARLVIMPREVPIGVITAFIGGPFFVYIARKGVSKI
ncbi:FecCD family ABC transporter permease [Halalkalibacterium ligniniphilum]|uniref:FecCD family ABC transporter permease n=1 Tax=Halalkalibacterium ligniniphilum TaxID=1134413 RepID=UPI00034714F2|nr:iron ABC transporter permease [Halalkalibacterium ligniniphilum]